jgi:hypothetical protein
VFRATGDAHRVYEPEGPHILPDGTVHRWSLDYEPREGKPGIIRLTFDGQDIRELEIPLDERDTPTRFDRFGIISTWVDGNGQLIYFDDLVYTCRQD